MHIPFSLWHVHSWTGAGDLMLLILFYRDENFPYHLPALPRPQEDVTSYKHK